MRKISDEVIAVIRQDRDIQAGDGAKIAALVEAKILPHFDFRRATQIALRAYWRHATPEQQELLTREFRTLLVRTYSGALSSYRSQVIEFRPLRALAGDSEVTVRSVVKQAAHQRHQPGRHLPQRVRRGSTQPRHRGPDRPARQQKPQELTRSARCFSD